MAAFPAFLLIFTALTLRLTLTSCMEVDFCKPFRLEHEKHPQRRAEQTKGARVGFRLSAFGQDFYLHLTPDATFLAAGGGSAASSASSDFRKCFYSGDVNADPDSFVAVSLCGVLRGASPKKAWSISLLQAPRTQQLNMDTFWKKRTGSAAELAPGIQGSTSPAGVQSHPTNFSVSMDKYNHLDQLDTSGFTECLLKFLGRSKRFASIPRFVEVMVVADQSMAAFHGDDLEHYLLTLMSVVARLYKITPGY